jgi:hypothetical protein
MHRLETAEVTGVGYFGGKGRAKMARTFLQIRHFRQLFEESPFGTAERPRRRGFVFAKPAHDTSLSG